MRDNLSIHSIDFNRNCSLTREEFLSFLPEKFRSEDIDPTQIAVSKGKGRIHGFLDDAQVFQIVLFDPNHNLQLSKYSDYKTRPTTMARTEFDELQHRYKRLLAHLHRECPQPCDAKTSIAELASLPSTVPVVALDYLEEAEVDLLKSKHGSLELALTVVIDMELKAIRGASE